MCLRRRRSAGILSALAVALTAAPAAADHSREQRITDDTAYTLSADQWRLGLWKADYGVLDPLMIGSHWWVWWFRLANAHVKWRWYFDDPWAFALNLQALYLDTRDLGFLDENLGTGRLWVVTQEAAASYYASERTTFSAGLGYTNVTMVGEINVEAFDGTAAAAVDNLQLWATGEYRVSRVTALVIHARYLVFQHLTGRGLVRYEPDQYTTVEIHGGGRKRALDFPHAWSVVPSVVLSWKTFNLRAGLGYGNWNVPLLNFVRRERTLIPDLDAYFVF